MARRTAELAAWANQTPAIIVNVQRQPGSNVSPSSTPSRRSCRGCEATLPAAVDVQVLSDQTTTIRASVSDVEFELLLSVGLVVLVIFVFLRSVPATVIPSLSVPLSLVGTLGGMYLFGFSIDNLSLMSLTIATGFVVDDAIVMIENIARYIEAGRGAARRRAQGLGRDRLHHHLADRVADRRADPAALHGRRGGPLFFEFAVTLATTIVLSAGVSLTLVPMLCALMLRHRPQTKRNGADRAAERAFEWIIARLRSGL